MLKSPWMLLVVVPLGFLLLAGVATTQLGGWTAASTLFASLGALVFCIGLFFTLPSRKAATVSRSQIHRFALDWLGWYPNTSEGDLRTALRKRFSGSAVTATAEAVVDGASTIPNGGGFFTMLVAAPAAAFRHRFFPQDPAKAEDIEAVLLELRAQGRW